MTHSSLCSRGESGNDNDWLEHRYVRSSICGSIRNQPARQLTDLVNQSWIACVFFNLGYDTAADDSGVCVLPDLSNVLRIRNTKTDCHR